MASGGGTVCLEVGDYPLRETLRIDGASSLSVRGQGQATRLLAQGAAIAVSKSNDVTLERFEIQSTSETTTAFAAISIDTTQNLHVQQLMVIVKSGGTGQAAIALSGQLAGLSFCDNMINAPLGLVSVSWRQRPEGRPDHAAEPGALRGQRPRQCATSGVVLQLNPGFRARLCRVLDKPD